MFIADIDNPFRFFLSSCGNTQSFDLQNVPPTSRDSTLGICEFLSDRWIHQQDLHKVTRDPVLFIISIDGLSSEFVYKVWEDNHLGDSARSLIPKYILDCKNPIVLFDNSAEGHCDDYIFKFVSQVTKMFNLNPKKTFYSNSAANVRDIHTASKYKEDFRVFFTNNYKEDTMSELLTEINEDQLEQTQKSLLFSCLNNAPRPHRAIFLGGLISKGLYDDGMISSPSVSFDQLYADSVMFLGKQHKEGRISQADLRQGIDYLHSLEAYYPMVLDQRTLDEVHMKSISQDGDFLNKLKSCEIDIITESFIDYTVYVTEKVFKPIIMKQPFMVLGPSRTLDFLRQNGYSTFEHLYTDVQAFDKQHNFMDRINMLLSDIETLQIKRDSPAIWQEIQEQNKQHAQMNFENFIKRKSHIDDRVVKDIASWLEIYPGYTDVFNSHNA